LWDNDDDNDYYYYYYYYYYAQIGDFYGSFTIIVLFCSKTKNKNVVQLLKNVHSFTVHFGTIKAFYLPTDAH